VIGEIESTDENVLIRIEEQAGFRRDRSTVHQILILRLIADKAK